MDNQRPVSPPFGVRLATLAPTAVEAARLRDQHVVPVVVDANALLAEAAWRARVLVPTFRHGVEGAPTWPRPSALSRAVASEAARLYAKPDLLDEIEEHLLAFAAQTGLNAGLLAELIVEDYLPYLRLVDLAGIVLDEPGFGPPKITINVELDHDLRVRRSGYVPIVKGVNMNRLPSSHS
jgi:hypothetical protein